MRIQYLNFLIGAYLFTTISKILELKKLTISYLSYDSLYLFIPISTIRRQQFKFEDLDKMFIVHWCERYVWYIFKFMLNSYMTASAAASADVLYIRSANIWFNLYSYE